MQDKIELLYEEILAQQKMHSQLTEMFDGDEPLVCAKMHEIMGMSKAFEIVAGHSVSDHMLKKTFNRKEQVK